MTRIRTARRHVAGPEVVAAMTPATGGSGLVVGLDRDGSPVTVALFVERRATRAAVVGGLPLAQLLVYRALGLGARVVVRSTRPAAWDGFARAVRLPRDVLAFLPPGVPVETGGTPSRPHLVVVDLGPSVGEADEVGPDEDDDVDGGWRCRLTVVQEVTPWDLDTMGEADVLFLRRLAPDEVDLLAGIPGIGAVRDMLLRLRSDVLTVASLGDVHWAVLGTTAFEQQAVAVAAPR